MPPKKIGVRVGKNAKKMAKAKAPAAGIKSTAVGNVSASNQDAVAKWLKLLRDPCGADLTGPCYAGCGTGLYVRQVQNIDFSGFNTAADGILEFTPTNRGNGVELRFAYSTTTGGSLGTAGAIALNGLISNGAAVAEKRCLAACFRIQYTDTEYNRKGLIGGIITPTADLFTGEPVYGTAANWLSVSPHVGRVGEMREFLWAPAEEDSTFQPGTNTDAPLQTTSGSTEGNTLRIVWTNIVPGSLTIQLVGCWEWVPAVESHMPPWAVPSARNPNTSVPFQAAIRGLGDLQKFLVSRAVAAAPMLVTAATKALTTAAVVGM